MIAARLHALILDMDGVVTNTAEAHASAWKQMFDPLLDSQGQPPFDIDSEYARYLDGRPRYEGVAALLRARGIDRPWGDEADPPDRETVCGLGNRKNEIFHRWLADHGVRTYAGTLALVDGLRRRGWAVAVISASRNGRRVLDSAGVADRFDVVVDGNDAADHDLAGKPDPAIFRFAAARLGVSPAAAVVVEDAPAGVEAGAAGGFGLVIGVARRQGGKNLCTCGADIVVPDLAALRHDAEAGLAVRRLSDLPSVWAEEAALTEAVPERLAVFLDFDGTLSPIVNDPDAAALLPGMDAVLRRLAAVVPTAVISGRDLADVRNRVGLDAVVYAGSHGFDIAGPGGLRDQVPQGERARPALDAAEEDLRAAVQGIEGATVERQAYSLAVHYRNVSDDRIPDLRQSVETVLADHDGLRLEEGRKVLQVKPAADWDKGRAVLWLRDRLWPDTVPLYIGDDVTDEDAFQAIAGRGVGIVVRGESDRPTAAGWAVDGPQDVRRLLDTLARRKANG